MIKNQARTSTIERDDRVYLFPTFASRTEDQKAWRVRVHGAVHGPVAVTLRKRLMLRLLRGVMRVSAEAMETEIFQSRISGFVASPERGRRIIVRAGEHSIPLSKKSKRNGQFSGSFRLDNEQFQHLQGQGAIDEGWLNLQLDSPHDQHQDATGRVQFVEREGVSIISDIDDTIKHTQVTSKRALLANTFLRDFKSVDGMARLYADWRRQGAVFHYVSSSPWQLFSPLHDYCSEYGFPHGTIHLRSFRLRDHMLRRILILRRHGKSAVIRGMFESFPQRRFLLVGDSGEKDPELYAALAKRFPQQVAGIYIRDIDDRRMSSTRVRRVFRHVPDDRWCLFEHAEELPSELPIMAATAVS